MKSRYKNEQNNKDMKQEYESYIYWNNKNQMNKK